MADTRERKRFTVWFPMKVKAGEGTENVAVSRNVSGKGVLMAAARELEIGRPVEVTFRLADEDTERTVEGQIVRTEKNSDDPDGLWPYRIAVQFDEPLDDLEPVLRELADKQPF